MDNSQSDQTKVEETNQSSPNKEDVKEEQKEKQEEKKREKRVINIEEDKRIIKSGKEEGDKQFQIDLKQAIRIYQKTLDTVKDIKMDYEGDKESDFFKFVLEYELKLTSNLSLSNLKLNNYEKSIDYDLTVIKLNHI